MQDFESIQLVDYLMHNPTVQTGGDNPAIASLMQKFPFFTPLRYINAAVVFNKNGITPELLNDMYSYQGNWINFQNYLHPETESTSAHEENEQLSEVVEENSPVSEVVEEEQQEQLQHTAVLEQELESLEELQLAEEPEPTEEVEPLVEASEELGVGDEFIHEPESTEDIGVETEATEEEAPHTPKIQLQADTLAFLRGEENAETPKYDLNELLAEEGIDEQLQQDEVVEVPAPDESCEVMNEEMPVEELIEGKQEEAQSEVSQPIEVSEDITIEQEIIEEPNESEQITEQETSEEVPVVELHEELTEEEFLKILEGKDAPVVDEQEPLDAKQTEESKPKEDALYDLPLMPYSSVDYFEQQGISVEKEAAAIIENEIHEQKIAKTIDVRDKSLMVMMKFSEWLMHFKKSADDKQSEDEGQKALKAMWQREKLASTFEDDSEEIPENVLEMAVNSITQEEGLASESLAEIYVKQQKFDKAIDMYKKLSLQFPEKNTYFASKIEEILKDNNSWQS